MTSAASGTSPTPFVSTSAAAARAALPSAGKATKASRLNAIGAASVTGGLSLSQVGYAKAPSASSAAIATAPRRAIVPSPIASDANRHAGKVAVKKRNGSKPGSTSSAAPRNAGADCT